MAQHLQPFQTKVTVVPREGELEITVNINITVNGQVTVDSVEAVAVQKKEENKSEPMIPQFTSGLKLNFGKDEK